MFNDLFCDYCCFWCMKTKVGGTKRKRKVARRKSDNNSEASVEYDKCLSGVAASTGKLLDNVGEQKLEQEDNAKDLCVTVEKKVCLFMLHRFDVLFSRCATFNVANV